MINGCFLPVTFAEKSRASGCQADSACGRRLDIACLLRGQDRYSFRRQRQQSLDFIVRYIQRLDEF